MARKKDPIYPIDKNEVLDASGTKIGSWWLDGEMICVENRQGLTKWARKSSANGNETLARLMLREPWAL